MVYHAQKDDKKPKKKKIFSTISKVTTVGFCFAA